MSVLKHGQQLDCRMRVFKIAASTLERQVKKYLQIIWPVSFVEYVLRCKKHGPCKKLKMMPKLSMVFSTLATPQTWLFIVRLELCITGKTNCSVKNKLYDYKVEMSFLPLELYIECTTHFPSSISGLEIFCNN